MCRVGVMVLGVYARVRITRSGSVSSLSAAADRARIARRVPGMPMVRTVRASQSRSRSRFASRGFSPMQRKKTKDAFWASENTRRK